VLKDVVIVFSVLGVFGILAVAICLLNLFGYRWPAWARKIVHALRRVVSKSSKRRDESIDASIDERDVGGTLGSELESKDMRIAESWTVSNVSKLEGPPVPPKIHYQGGIL
jgi:hypothetical protein